jgi:hypothetical protein
MRIHHTITNPPTPSEDWHERWEGPDQGLICSWLRGIAKSKEEPALAAKARAGELPVLAWRGGLEKAIKTKTKIGAMAYVATWQGLRGEDLDVDTETDVHITCSRTGVTVLFTQQLQKLLQADDIEGA